MGHEMTFADNGEEAVENIKETDFDLILMDVRMPVMSGPEATEIIRKLSGFKCMIPIIAVVSCRYSWNDLFIDYSFSLSAS